MSRRWLMENAAKEPYRLIAQQGQWSLIAEHNDHPAVFALSDIHLVQPLTESFRYNERLYRRQRV